MKYSLHPKELNNWKARITERVVDSYIKDSLITKLKEEGWDDVIFTSAWAKFKFSWFHDGTFQPERELFVANGLFPNRKLLIKFERLTEILNNVPDGFLIKLNKTGKSKCLGDALVELELDSKESWEWCGHRFVRSEHKINEQLPIVDGEIEIIEIKSGKSNLPQHQIMSYVNAIKRGYLLRFFHVYILSFEQNKFEIKERKIMKSSEIKTKITFD